MWYVAFFGPFIKWMNEWMNEWQDHSTPAVQTTRCCTCCCWHCLWLTDKKNIEHTTKRCHDRQQLAMETTHIASAAVTVRHIKLCVAMLHIVWLCLLTVGLQTVLHARVQLQTLTQFLTTLHTQTHVSWCSVSQRKLAKFMLATTISTRYGRIQLVNGHFQC